MKKMFRWMTLGIVAASGGCVGPFDPGNGACTAEFRPGVRAQVPAGADGFVPAESWLIVREGAYADSSRFHGNGPWQAGAAGEREGTYEVTVRAPGFRPWTQTGVRVEDGGCHVETQDLVVDLQPAIDPAR